MTFPVRRDNTLRICFFNRSYWPDFGASGQLLTELAEGLVRERGSQVTVVAGPAGSASPQWKLCERGSRHGVEIFRAWGTAFRRGRFAGRAANYMSYFLSVLLPGFGCRAQMSLSL